MTTSAKSEFLTQETISVVVCAPLRQDSEIIEQVLVEEELAANVVESADALADRLADHLGVLVCSQEGLTIPVRAALSRVLASQPNWARLPVMLIFEQARDNDEIMRELDEISPHCDVIILHRPMRPLEFTSAVKIAIKARRRQLEIRNHLAFQKELQSELAHRVKNTLSTFMAIYQISYRESSDLADFQKRFNNRMRGLVAVQSMLAGERDENGVDKIVDAVLAPYSGRPAQRIRIDGKPVSAGGRCAFLLALILNEMATNAVKYGALSNAEGRVFVTWSQEPLNGALALRWRETGGPPTSPPQKTGYGTRFIEMSAAGLGADLAMDYRVEGLDCTMTIPAAALRPDGLGSA